MHVDRCSIGIGLFVTVFGIKLGEIFSLLMLKSEEL